MPGWDLRERPDQLDQALLAPRGASQGELVAPAAAEAAIDLLSPPSFGYPVEGLFSHAGP